MKLLFSNGRVMRIMRGPLKGYRYIVKPDTGFASLLGRWEKESTLVYNNSIFKGFVVFDLGANYGIHALLYSKLVGQSGKVYAFEPLPSNIADLYAHIEMNGIRNIEVVPEAVSDKRGEAEFRIGAHNSQGTLNTAANGKNLVKVQTNTLDDFCRAKKVYPDFVKVDIEGAEGVALDGFHNAVEVSHPFFAIDLHNPRCDLQVGSFLSKHGYEVYRIKNSYSKGIKEQQKFLEPVKRLDLSHPHPDGIWGVIWAVHPSRRQEVQQFIQNNT